MSGRLKTLFALHLLLMLYSLASVCSKSAAQYTFLSLPFCLFYAAVFVILALYALGWQQIIKRLPLTTAFSNKAVTVVWGIIWGFLFFAESITPLKVVGAVVIIIGVLLFVRADDGEGPDEDSETGSPESATSGVGTAHEGHPAKKVFAKRGEGGTGSNADGDDRDGTWDTGIADDVTRCESNRSVVSLESGDAR